MNRVYTNLALGTFWIFAAIWMYISKTANTASVAVLIVLGCAFYWAAFRIYRNPQMKTNNKNLMQKLSDPNYNQKKTKKK